MSVLSKIIYMNDLFSVYLKKVAKKIMVIYYFKTKF